MEENTKGHCDGSVSSGWTVLLGENIHIRQQRVSIIPCVYLVVAPKPSQAVWVHDAEDFVLCILPANVVVVPAVRQELVDIVPQQPAVWRTTAQAPELSQPLKNGPPASGGTLDLFFPSYLLSVRWASAALLVETRA